MMKILGLERAGTRSMTFFLATMIMGALCCQPVISQEPAAITIEPYMNVDVVKPGESFLIGFHFTIKEPWHIYWKYPGASGLPTRVKLSLPDGLSGGELQFPTPKLFMQPGDLVGYGYESEAFFWIPVTSAAEIGTGTSLPITGEVRWLGCSDRCIPGKRNFSLTVTFGNETKHTQDKLFADWLARLPKPIPAELGSTISRVSGTLAQGPSKSHFEYSVEWPHAPLEVYWFPFPDKSLILENVRSETHGTVTKISFDAELQQGGSVASDQLPSVLSYRDPSGERIGYDLTLHLRK